MLRSYGWEVAGERYENSNHHRKLPETKYVANIVHVFQGPYNLSGITLDLRQYYPDVLLSNPDYDDLDVDWYSFDIYNPYTDRVQLAADLIYYDGVLGVARVAVSTYTPEPETYPEDFPGKLRFSWPLDIEQTIFQQEVLTLVAALDQ